MSKMKRELETMYENEEPLGGVHVVRRELSVYAPPKPYVPKAVNTKQRATMILTLLEAAKARIGYEPVSLVAMREDPSVHKLLDMLETCRPGGSKEEQAFLQTYIQTHPHHVDDYGNHIILVPIPDGHPRILWSCHTDTVHRHGGSQKVEVNAGFAWTSDGSCLGSDDTVGIWLALEMINAGVPGAYVFHRDEESGGGGSAHMADVHEDWLGKFDCAIALDRAGYSDVITYQGGERCCSDAFANSLAGILGGSYKPCETGVFTDTANYVDAIGECTNLSVGYFRQHGPTEHTHLGFAMRLRDALLAADWSKLVFERKPGEREQRYAYVPYGAGGGKAYPKLDWKEVDAMEEYIRAYPWRVAEFLVEMGVSIDEIEDELGAYDEKAL